MIVARRRLLALGAGAGLLALAPRAGGAQAVHEIAMRGDASGAHVGFDPIGLAVRPGDTLRWTNADAGNAHTATAYHPKNFDRPRRIPEAATPWDSDYLLPGESFTVTLTAEGVYDFYCVPHEHAGMVGRVVVGAADADGWMDDPAADAGLPEVALRGFPTVADIVAAGVVRPSGLG
jgi:plastocyanin